MSSTSSHSDADFDHAGLIANRYRIKQRLGKGTYGEVFLADDLKFNPPRSVALKMLHTKFLDEPGVRADIEREASILARFSHPNILRVIDFDISENQAFIVTELAENGSLARKIRPDPTRPPTRMPFEEVGWYLEQLTDALDEAHQAGLIHRDLKPLNILLNKRGRPLIADFGLATAVSSSQSSVLVDAQTSGTPPYMAPEQWMGHAGRASDIYALGIITYQLITGELPYQGNHFELMGQHLNAPIPRLGDHAPGLAYPPALDNVIAGVMAKDPRQRTHSALEFYRNYRNALMPFSSPSGTFETYPAQGNSPPATYQGQPSTPSGSNPSNPPGSSTPPGHRAYPVGPASGNPPPEGDNPAAFPPAQPDLSGPNAATSFSGATASALPSNFLPRPVERPTEQPAYPPQPGIGRAVQPGQPGTNPPVPTGPGPVRTAKKMNPVFIGIGVVSAVIVIGAVIAGILLLGNNPQNSTPTQAPSNAARPTSQAAATTAETTTEPPTSEASGTPEPTTPEATTAAPGAGQAVIARQGSLRKVAISSTFAETAIHTISSSASSNTTLQVFSSSETPDKVKTELDNGLNGEGYTYAVPDSHKSAPSDYYGGYTKEGAPDLVYVILDDSNLVTVLKNNGVDDTTIQKIVDETKGQKSIIFSYEGDGFVDAAFPPQNASTSTPPDTTVAATAGTSQAGQTDIPVYNGATPYEVPDSILSQVRDSLKSTSAQNIKFEAYKVVAQDSELRKYFESYLAQAGWANASSSLPSDTAKTYSDAGITPVGPFTKGSETVLILIGKGHYASEFTGLSSNENVYLIIRANG